MHRRRRLMIKWTSFPDSAFVILTRATRPKSYYTYMQLGASLKFSDRFSCHRISSNNPFFLRRNEKGREGKNSFLSLVVMFFLPLRRIFPLMDCFRGLVFATTLMIFIEWKWFLKQNSPAFFAVALPKVKMISTKGQKTPCKGFHFCFVRLRTFIDLNAMKTSKNKTKLPSLTCS